MNNKLFDFLVQHFAENIIYHLEKHEGSLPETESIFQLVKSDFFKSGYNLESIINLNRDHMPGMLIFFICEVYWFDLSQNGLKVSFLNFILKRKRDD